MRLYYVDEPLNAQDLAFASNALIELGGSAVTEQVRIPYVFPTDAASGTFEQMMRRHIRLVRRHLANAGIAIDRGTKIAFVAPKNIHWYSVLIEAFRAETGAYPFLIQTGSQREALGNPGKTRVIDTEGMLHGLR